MFSNLINEISMYIRGIENIIGIIMAIIMAIMGITRIILVILYVYGIYKGIKYYNRIKSTEALYEHRPNRRMMFYRFIVLCLMLYGFYKTFGLPDNINIINLLSPEGYLIYFLVILLYAAIQSKEIITNKEIISFDLFGMTFRRIPWSDVTDSRILQDEIKFNYKIGNETDEIKFTYISEVEKNKILTIYRNIVATK